MEKCLKCGHEWFKRKQERPKVCPNKTCHSPIWDNPTHRKRDVLARLAVYESASFKFYSLPNGKPDYKKIASMNRSISRWIKSLPDMRFHKSARGDSLTITRIK